jgi:hypothetical protein
MALLQSQFGEGDTILVDEQEGELVFKEVVPVVEGEMVN